MKLENITSTSRTVPNGPTFPPGVPVDVDDDELAEALLEQTSTFVRAGTSGSSENPKPAKKRAPKPAKKRAPKKSAGSSGSDQEESEA